MKTQNQFKAKLRTIIFFFIVCSQTSIAKKEEFYGTLTPFASEAIYFAMTDRFVDGDSKNNHEKQGGEFPTFDQKLVSKDGQEANVGYLGGDLKGVLNNAQYLKDMGFTAVWLTPIMDNPDEHFSGGTPIEFGGKFCDGGKTGYHGYWINNFFVEDEHYVSKDLNFKQYSEAMKSMGFKIVFDIVCNHGSPSFTMPMDQPKFGELYDQKGELVADHQNLQPEDLDPQNPLHAYFRHERDIAELSNFDDENPEVLQYFIDAYQSWIDRGVDAFRIDTIRHVPHRFWRQFSDAIREKKPDFFMFGESYKYDANFLAQHTLPKNGGVSVLDFMCRQAMQTVFEKNRGSYKNLESYLHLTHGPYQNPYDLVTFYDNHDMSRIDGDDKDFINANNWLFTSRGIPCLYYGSEIGFMAGKEEHTGNRNYFGQENIEKAKKHPIHAELKEIANIRKNTPALQRGLQLNISLRKDTATFLRVYQKGEISQTALVLLNKSDERVEFIVDRFLQNGNWHESLTNKTKSLTNNQLTSVVPGNGVQVWILNEKIQVTELIKELNLLMKYK